MTKGSQQKSSKKDEARNQMGVAQLRIVHAEARKLLQGEKAQPEQHPSMKIVASSMFTSVKQVSSAFNALHRLAESARSQAPRNPRLSRQWREREPTFIPGKLRVKIVSARDLVAPDRRGPPSAFVTLRLGRVERSTSIASRDRSPTWRQNQEFNFDVDRVRTVKLEVLSADEGDFKAQTSIGVSRFNIYSLQPDEWQEFRLGVFDKLDRDQRGMMRGEVLVRAFWQPFEDIMTSREMSNVPMENSTGMCSAQTWRRGDSARMRTSLGFTVDEDSPQVSFARASPTSLARTAVGSMVHQTTTTPRSRQTFVHTQIGGDASEEFAKVPDLPRVGDELTLQVSFATGSEYPATRESNLVGPHEANLEGVGSVLSPSPLRGMPHRAPLIARRSSSGSNEIGKRSSDASVSFSSGGSSSSPRRRGRGSRSKRATIKTLLDSADIAAHLDLGEASAERVGIHRWEHQCAPPAARPESPEQSSLPLRGGRLAARVRGVTAALRPLRCVRDGGGGRGGAVGPEASPRGSLGAAHDAPDQPTHGVVTTSIVPALGSRQGALGRRGSGGCGCSVGPAGAADASRTSSAAAQAGLMALDADRASGGRPDTTEPQPPPAALSASRPHHTAERQSSDAIESTVEPQPQPASSGSRPYTTGGRSPQGLSGSRPNTRERQSPRLLMRPSVDESAIVKLATDFQMTADLHEAPQERRSSHGHKLLGSSSAGTWLLFEGSAECLGSLRAPSAAHPASRVLHFDVAEALGSQDSHGDLDDWLDKFARRQTACRSGGAGAGRLGAEARGVQTVGSVEEELDGSLGRSPWESVFSAAHEGLPRGRVAREIWREPIEKGPRRRAATSRGGSSQQRLPPRGTGWRMLFGQAVGQEDCEDDCSYEEEGERGGRGLHMETEPERAIPRPSTCPNDCLEPADGRYDPRQFPVGLRGGSSASGRSRGGASEGFHLAAAHAAALSASDADAWAAMTVAGSRLYPVRPIWSGGSTTPSGALHGADADAGLPASESWAPTTALSARGMESLRSFTSPGSSRGVVGPGPLSRSPITSRGSARGERDCLGRGISGWLCAAAAGSPPSPTPLLPDIAAAEGGGTRGDAMEGEEGRPQLPALPKAPSRLG